MQIGVYPGSFDPVTLGHLDIIDRASRLCDHLVVGVLQNGSKYPMFTLDQRIRMLKKVTEPYGNVDVLSFDGLLVDFLKQQDAKIVFRGLRAVTDFEYELHMAQTNHSLYPEMETVFLTANVQYSYLSSTIVKDVLVHNGDISNFVPAPAIDMIKQFRR